MDMLALRYKGTSYRGDISPSFIDRTTCLRLGGHVFEQNGQIMGAESSQGCTQAMSSHDDAPNIVPLLLQIDDLIQNHLPWALPMLFGLWVVTILTDRGVVQLLEPEMDLATIRTLKKLRYLRHERRQREWSWSNMRREFEPHLGVDDEKLLPHHLGREGERVRWIAALPFSFICARVAIFRSPACLRSWRVCLLSTCNYEFLQDRPDYFITTKLFDF